MSNIQEQGLNYMGFVQDFHRAMLDHKLQLVYEGEVNQAITKAFAALAEKNMSEDNVDLGTIKRVYHVMVESLQNISKHADDIDTGEPIRPGKGIFLVGGNDDGFVITTGNVVNNSRIEVIKSLIDKVNGLSQEEVKELYVKQMREARLSDKGGAGLGFIDIVKKTGNVLEYHFEPLNDRTSFFILKSTVTYRGSN